MGGLDYIANLSVNTLSGKFFVKSNSYLSFFLPEQGEGEEQINLPIPISKYRWDGVKIRVSVYINGVNLDLDTVFTLNLSYSFDSFIPTARLKIFKKDVIQINYGDNVLIKFIVDNTEIDFFKGVVDEIVYEKNFQGSYYDIGIMGSLYKLKNYNITGTVITDYEVQIKKFFSSGQIISRLFEPLNISISVPQGVILKKPINLNNKPALDFLKELLDLNGWVLKHEGDRINIVDLQSLSLSTSVAIFDENSYSSLRFERDGFDIANSLVVAGESLESFGYARDIVYNIETLEDENGTKTVEIWTTYMGDTVIEQKRIEKINGVIVNAFTYTAVIEDFLIPIENNFFGIKYLAPVYYIKEERFYLWSRGENGEYSVKKKEISYFIDSVNWKVQKQIEKQGQYLQSVRHVFDFPNTDVLSQKSEIITEWQIKDEYTAIERKIIKEYSGGEYEYIAGWGETQSWAEKDEKEEMKTIFTKDIPEFKTVGEKIEKKEIVYKYKIQNFIDKFGEKKESYNLELLNSVEELKNFAKSKFKQLLMNANRVNMQTFFIPFLSTGDIILIDGNRVVISNINISISYQTDFDVGMSIDGYLI